MSILEFGEWLPDQSPLGNPGCMKATNVVPIARGYIPFPDLAILTDATDTRPLGARQGIDSDGNIFHYAGDTSKLYQNVDNVWTDKSKTGGYSTSTGERWEFTQWGNQMLATNFSDNPQAMTFNGSAFSDLTTDFQARRITVIGNFVVVANTNDSSDGEVTNRVRWSAIGDETDWTVDPATLADFQDLSTVGPVLHLAGGEFGLIFQRSAVWRMTFVGSPTVFQFDQVLPPDGIVGIGAIAPGAVAQYGNRTYALSDDGFYVIQSGQAQRIGIDKVDRFVTEDLDYDNLHRITTAMDQRRVYWSYPGQQSSGGDPEKIVVYDRPTGKWSLIEDKTISMIWNSSGIGVTLEGLDNYSTSIDDLGLSLDAPAWKGDNKVAVAAFNTGFKSGFFQSSTNKKAVFRTKEYEFNPGRQTHVKAIRHVIDGGTVKARVGSRDSQSDNITFGSAKTERSTNRFTARSNSRYHQFEFEVTGNWNHAIGMQIEPWDIAPGGRRGK